MQKVTIEVNNPTMDQLTKIHAILNGQEKVTKTDAALAPLADAAKTKKGSKKTPPKTVSPDEDEDFADDAMEEEELETSDDEDEDETDEDETDEDESVTWNDLLGVINEYGETNPTTMRAIYASSNVKGTKELKTLPKKWKAVYRKVKAKLTTKTKGKK